MIVRALMALSAASKSPWNVALSLMSPAAQVQSWESRLLASQRRKNGSQNSATCASQLLEPSGRQASVRKNASDVYVVRTFRTLVWQFKRVSGSSGLKVQAAICC